MPLAPMHRNDEDPPWVATISVNGTQYNYSAGYTFTVTLSKGGTVALTKTTGITGASGGRVTVAWAVGDFDLAPGLYQVLLTIMRTADSKEHTVQDSVSVVARG